MIDVKKILRSGTNNYWINVNVDKKKLLDLLEMITTTFPKQNDELVDGCFTSEDLNLIQEMKLPMPSEIKNHDNDDLFDQVCFLIRKYGGEKGYAIKENKDEDMKKCDQYMNILRVYKGLVKPKEENIGGRYKQDRRNAYKIGAGGKYGDLIIHMPGLLTTGILRAFKNGKLVYEQAVDDDTLELLTKRYNAKKIYSELSKKVFNELNQLSKLPNHRSSKKFGILERKTSNRIIAKLLEKDKIMGAKTYED